MKKRIYSTSATERPIIFSGPMVRAILAGEKTQTRRMPKNAKQPFRHGLTGDWLWVRETWRESLSGEIEYKAAAEKQLGRRKNKSETPWKSAIFMPQKIARITLEITGVRGEHLHEISESDAIAEGAHFWAQEQDQEYEDSRLAFRALWDSVSGTSWDDNPYVIVITFRRVINPQKSLLEEL